MYSSGLIQKKILHGSVIFLVLSSQRMFNLNRIVGPENRIEC